MDLLVNLIPFAIVLVVAIVAGVVCWFMRPHETADWFRARFDFFARLWEFWGPRLTDRTFIAAIGANAVALGFLDPTKAELWQLAIWVGANLLFPIWDNHPAGEKVLRSRQIETDMLPAAIAGPEELSAHIQAAVDRAIAKYAQAGAH